MKCPLCGEEAEAVDGNWTDEYEKLANHIDAIHDDLFPDSDGCPSDCLCGVYDFWGTKDFAAHLREQGDNLEAHLMLGVLAQQ